MFQPFIYKSFNLDLKDMSNNQLIYHWKNYGIKENRICSLDSFFEKYPEYVCETTNIEINDKIKNMINYHLNNGKISGKLEEKKNIFKYHNSSPILNIIINGINDTKVNLTLNSIKKLENNYNIIVKYQINSPENSNLDEEWVYNINEGNILNNYFYDVLNSIFKNINFDLFIFRNIDSNDSNEIIKSLNNNFIIKKKYYKQKNIEDLNILITNYDHSFILNSPFFLFYPEILIIKHNEIEEENYKSQYYLPETNEVIKDNNSSSIKTYIINLDSREDRYENCIKSLHNLNFINNYERFSAIIPDKNTISNTMILNPLKVWRKKNRDYFKGALGCKMSHLEVLKKVLQFDNNTKYILILEDDAIFENYNEQHILNALNYLENIVWDIFYLSVNLLNKENAYKVSENVLKINKGLTTVAQLFQVNKIQKIIDLIECTEEEIDNTYNLLENKYCLYPMCVYQDTSYSNINNMVTDYGKYHLKYIY
jgi:GR25 family glycosyltransferase involved in LPS biosynthesis